ncbi:dihydropteroate synthase [Leucobacter chromiiresistens]|uniref:7,8-dihydroneopterin aldolase n=3 Tax=Leucobacter chromiiresistens TaxID=1079994 RepID=A0A1H0Z8G7_9MICO|nr:dihydropteroate synthase [Leucobacter chromiiresistens]SDQ23451.1 Dihydroneopterin aldolase [Leucobacter chromiiresistens]
MSRSDARPVVMGVLNVTPDSFSDGGAYAEHDAAIAHGVELARLGADLVDVGGESTRPGAAPVRSSDEQERVIPVIRALASRSIGVSVDTLHADTARAAVAAGARWINDVSGGLHDPEMLAAAADASRRGAAGLIIGHWRGVPDPAHLRSDYADVVSDVTRALAERASAAVAAGVDPGRIVLDPGLGFDKTGAQGWQLLAGLDEVRALGFPVLIGASRKRMLGEAIDGLAAPRSAAASAAAQPVAAAPAHDRDLATAVVSALAAEAGSWGVRVHDVHGTRQALAVQSAWSDARRLVRARRPRAASPDRIALTGLEVFAHHGVFDFEREQGQRFVIDAVVEVDLAGAAAEDALARTVHYGELADAIVDAVAGDPVDLIETVAERVARVALGFAGVRSARITVHKPDAPIAQTFSDVSVTVERRADEGAHA